MLVAPRNGPLHVLGRARGGRWTLARLDLERGALVSIDLPELKNPLVSTSPGGGRLMISESGSRMPATLHVYEIGTGAWSEVRNPGVIGWEPLVPR